jgi:hypothetical protein
MIAATHSNDANYYSMQIAADFFSNSIFYRSTNASGTTAWNRFALYNNGYSGNLYANIFYDNDNTAFYFDGTGATALSLNGNITFGPSNPYITASSYIHFPGGAYFNSGTVYMEANLKARGGVGNDTAVALTLTGGTGGYTVIDGSARSPIFYDQNDTAYYADFNTTGDSIRAAGNIIAYYSDDRLKTKFGNITNAIDKVCKLNGFYYEANETAQKLGYKPAREVGVSAQELEAVLPEVVTGAPIGRGYLTVDYERIVPLLIEAIKEQQTHINNMQQEINSLKK